MATNDPRPHGIACDMFRPGLHPCSCGELLRRANMGLPVYMSSSEPRSLLRFTPSGPNVVCECGFSVFADSGNWGAMNHARAHSGVDRIETSRGVQLLPTLELSADKKSFVPLAAAPMTEYLQPGAPINRMEFAHRGIALLEERGRFRPEPLAFLDEDLLCEDA